MGRSSSGVPAILVGSIALLAVYTLHSFLNDRNVKSSISREDEDEEQGERAKEVEEASNTDPEEPLTLERASEALKDDDHALVKKALMRLVTLSSYVKIQEYLRDSGQLEQLIRLQSSADMTISYNAAWVLANCTMNAKNQAYLMEQTPYGKSLMRIILKYPLDRRQLSLSPDSELLRKRMEMALRATGNLCMTEHNATIFLNGGVLESLSCLLTEDVMRLPSLASQVLAVLGNVSYESAHHKDRIISSQVIPRISDLLKNTSDARTLERCSRCLANFGHKGGILLQTHLEIQEAVQILNKVSDADARHSMLKLVQILEEQQIHK